MVHQKESNHSCRTPARVRESPCRLEELTTHRFQGLEFTQGDFSKSGQETESLLNRFVCHQDKQLLYIIASVLQVEDRSHSTAGCGCPVNTMGNPRSLHVSHICTDSLLLGNYSSCVVQSNLFHTIIEQSDGYPNPLTTIPDIVTSRMRQNHPLATQGLLPLATWPVSDASMQ